MQMRLVVNDVPVSVNRDMATEAAASLACEQVGIADCALLYLRRVADGSWVEPHRRIGEVCEDGEELELARDDR